MESLQIGNPYRATGPHADGEFWSHIVLSEKVVVEFVAAAGQESICMTGVRRTNHLLLDPELYSAQRRNARFINTGMIVSLSGAVASDALEDGTVKALPEGHLPDVERARKERQIIVVDEVERRALGSRGVTGTGRERWKGLSGLSLKKWRRIVLLMSFFCDHWKSL